MSHMCQDKPHDAQASLLDTCHQRTSVITCVHVKPCVMTRSPAEEVHSLAPFLPQADLERVQVAEAEHHHLPVVHITERTRRCTPQTVLCSGCLKRALSAYMTASMTSHSTTHKAPGEEESSMTTYPPVGQGVLAQLEGSEDGGHATDGQRHLVAVLAGQTGDALAEGLAEAAVLMMATHKRAETGACDVERTGGIGEHLGHAMGIMTPAPVGSPWAQPPPQSSFPTIPCLCCCLRNSRALSRLPTASAAACGTHLHLGWCGGWVGPWHAGSEEGLCQVRGALAHTVQHVLGLA